MPEGWLNPAKFRYTVVTNLSSKARFTEAELESLSSWDLPDVSGLNDNETAEKVSPIAEPAQILTVEEIEATQKQAFEEAFLQGKEEGHKKGYETGHEEGFQKGFEEGSRKGYDENLHLLRSQAAELVSLLESLSQPFTKLDDQVEKELVKLAMGVASQLVRREIKTDPGQVVAVVREAVSSLPVSSQKITLHMHPEDAELVRSSLALDEMTLPWNIVEEPLITRGGCKLDTEASHIDATVENRLAAIVANVMGGEREEDAE